MAGSGQEVSWEAQVRLAWIDFNRTRGRNAAWACGSFRIGRQAFYRWWRRYDPGDLCTLEAQSYRPRNCRQLIWTPELAECALRLRWRFSRRGAGKLAV